MVQIIRNPSGFAGYSVNPNTGTFTAPFMGYTNQRIPLPNNAVVQNRGRSALDNIYGMSTDPRIAANPPSVVAMNNANQMGLLNRRNVTPSSYASRMMSENQPSSTKTNTGGFSSQGQELASQGLIETPLSKQEESLGKGLLNFAQSPFGEGFANALLKQSGYSTMPQSFGQALGVALEQGKLYEDAENKQRKTIKLADGFQYFINDDGTTERVNPDVSVPVDTKAADDLRKEKFKNANDLRDEHTKQSGEFIKVRDAYGRILASGQNPSAAGDLALIFNYMKMLDPGSTVREGEFANAQNSAGIPGRIVAAYNNALKGERLNPDQRDDFMDRSRGLYNSMLKGQEYLDSTYTKLAENFDVEPDKVVLDFNAPIEEALFEYDIKQLSLEELKSFDTTNLSEKQKNIILKILKELSK
jgi:hypothetical protein